MNIFLVFRVRIIAALAITVLCSGCGLILVGAILALPKNVAAGRAEVPANSSVVLDASMQPEATNRFYYISGTMYSFVPLEQSWNDSSKWSIVRYNNSLQPLDSFEFAVRYKETPISFFRCGDRLLLLSTCLDNDSLNLLGRWFDISAKPLSDEVTLIREDRQRGPYTILPSPDSSHFLVRNARYRKDATIDVVLKVFNSRLELLQSRVVSRASDKQELKMVQVDNAGALYTVQSVEKEGLLVQRSLPGGSTLDISVPIALSHKDSTKPPIVNSTFLVPENGDKSYLFSTVQAMGETGASIPVLDCIGSVIIPDDELWCIDKRNILLRCYELNVPASRLMHLRL